MTKPEDVLNIARSKIGVSESPANSNRQEFGQWYGSNGVPWCAEFVSYCFAQAGLPLSASTARGFAYCPKGAEWFQKRGRWGPTPRPGAIAFFKMPGCPQRINHVGIVEVPDVGGKVQTIEGNTGGAGASQRMGGTVMRKLRPKSLVAGYGYPDFDAAPAPVLPPNPVQVEAPAYRTFNPPVVFPGIVADWTTPDGGMILLGDNGAVYAFFGAPYPGPNPPIPNGVTRHDPYFLEPVGDQLKDPHGPGGWLLSTSGAVYALGGAQYHGGCNGKPYFVGFAAGKMEAVEGRYKIYSTVDPDGPGYGPDF